jgi:VanZ family protein
MNILSYNSWLALARPWRILFMLVLLAMVQYAGGRDGHAPAEVSNHLISYCLNLAHQPLYAMVGLTFLLALGLKPGTRLALFLAVSFAMLVGIYDELHQATIEYRDSCLWDIGSDMLGATFGVIVAIWSDRKGGVFAHLLPMAGLLVLSLLWNFLPSFAYQYPLPFTG